MSTYYVSTTGSNSTGDGSSGNPWATTTYAVSMSASGDTISISGGTYNNEKFSTGDKSLTFIATGTVIWDGTNTTAGPVVTINTSTVSRAFTMRGVGGTFELKNYTGSTSLISASVANNVSISINQTTFTSNSNANGFYANNSWDHYMSFNQCTFTGYFSGSAIYGRGEGSSSTLSLTNSTITDSVTGIYTYSSRPSITSSGNTFTRCYYAYNLANTTASITASNNTYTDVFGWLLGGAKNWTQWKAVGVNYDNSGSTSNTLGLTFYVNKSGSDSNTGYGPTNALLTIGAAVTKYASGAATGVMVGSGLYNEGNLFSGVAYGIYVYADGNVILDGTSKGAVSAFTLGRLAVIAPASTGGRWRIQNYSGTTLIAASSAVHDYNFTLDSIDFVSSGNQYAYYDSTGTVYRHSVTVTNCSFSGFTVAAVRVDSSAGSAASVLKNNTFYNNQYGFYRGTDNSSWSVLLANNIFMNNIYNWYFNQALSTPASQIFLNNLYYTTTSMSWKYSSTVLTDLAGLLSLQSSGYEIGSLIEQPAFEDAANNIFYLKTQTSISRTQGCYPFGKATGSAASDSTWVVSGTADNSGWYCSDGSVTKNGTTGFFELTTGSVGVLYSPVFDLTTVQVVKQVNLAVDQSWPVGMIDTTKSDVKPNYQTVEIRASGTTFNQGDVSPAWTEVKTEQNFSPVVGRFVQLRLTFRGDDVGA